eukprot:7375914-Prymnesium_polylepis.1
MPLLLSQVVELVHEVSNEAGDITGENQRGWLHDIVSWLISNSLEVEGLMQSQLCTQEAYNVPRMAALEWLRLQPVVPPVKDLPDKSGSVTKTSEGQDETSETPLGASRGAEDESMAAIFSSMLMPSILGEEQQASTLEEEVPDANATIARLLLDLKVSKGDNDDRSGLAKRYGHIKSVREAVTVLARNCFLAPPDTSFGWFKNPSQLIEMVSRWTSLLDSSSPALFDPDEEGDVSEQVKKAMLEDLYSEMQYIDERFLKRSFDVPMDKCFAGSAFADPSETKAKWVSTK